MLRAALFLLMIASVFGIFVIADIFPRFRRLFLGLLFISFRGFLIMIALTFLGTQIADNTG
jgi:hypothetical protein